MLSISENVYTVASILALAALTYQLYRNVIAPQFYFKRLGIPSPPATLYFGHILYFKNHGFPQAYLNYTRQMGPVYGVMFGRVPEVVISDIDMIKEMTVKKFNQFTNRANLIDLPEESPFHDGLLNIRDQKWKRVRSIIVPAFSSAKLRQIITIINNIGQKLVDQLQLKCNEDGQVDIWQSYHQVTMEAILAAAFGVELNDSNESNSLINTARRLGEGSDRLLVLVPLFPRFVVQLLLKMRRQGRTDELLLRDTVMKVIESRREQGRPDRKDLLQVIIDAGKNGSLTDNEIIAQSLTFLLAGDGTTASALSFTSYALALNSDIQDRLINEIDENCPDETSIDYDTVCNLTYLDMVINESLRMYPPVIRYSRQAGEDVTINGVFIPKDITISIPVHVIHQNPDLWPNPNNFDPERFTPEVKAQRNPYSYLPFGVGPRACIGMRLALVETKLILIRVLQKFRLTVVKETQIPLELQGGVVSSPKDGIRLGIISRNG